MMYIDCLLQSVVEVILGLQCIAHVQYTMSRAYYIAATAFLYMFLVYVVQRTSKFIP